jgi:hypothetical protein
MEMLLNVPISWFDDTSRELQQNTRKLTACLVVARPREAN